MITTITGFNGKKNQATYVTATLAAMCSLNKGTKTLAIQLVDKDLESIEYILTGVEAEKKIVDEGLTFTNEGIDGLMRIADNLKLNREDFDQMCLSLRKENRLDIAEMTKSSAFTLNLKPRLDNVFQILKNAKEVYDDIFVLLPSNNDEIVKAINENEVVDRCIYCVKQGHYKKGVIYGESPVLLVVDYDEESRFSLRTLRNTMKLNAGVVTKKIERNIRAKDAAYMSELLGFMIKNRDISEEDINYVWYKDVLGLLAEVLGVRTKYLEVDYSFEQQHPYEKTLVKMENKLAQDVKTIMKEEKKDSGSFLKKNKHKK